MALKRGLFTSAPLDSAETRPGTVANDPGQVAALITSFAYQLPLRLLRRPTPGFVDRVAKAKVPLGPKIEFRDFAMAAVKNWQSVRNLYEHLQRDFHIGRPVNSHPLLRAMRDHWLWNWYETFQTFHHVATNGSVSDHIHFWQVSGVDIVGYVNVDTAADELILIGPVLRTWADTTDATAQFGDFIDIISEAWSSVPEGQLPAGIEARSGGRFPLYTDLTLAQLAGARSRLSTQSFSANSKRIRQDFYQIRDAIISSGESGTYRSIFVASLRITGRDNPRGEGEAREAALPQILEAQAGRISTSWRAYIRESESFLGLWLNRSLWELVAQEADAASWGVIGLRLARFLATHFLANECSIYRVDYSGKVPALHVAGAYSDDAGGDRKAAAIAVHMREIADDDERRRRSICYRALYTNSAQYVETEDPLAEERDRRLAFPADTEWDRRGRSAFAVPIRVNGAVWGVLELISFSKHHFPFNVRSRVVEIDQAFGAALSFYNTSAMLNAIDRVTCIAGLGVEEKKDAIVTSLPNYFMCPDVVIVRVTKKTDQEFAFDAVASCGSLGMKITAEEMVDVQAELDSFVRSKSPVMVTSESIASAPETYRLPGGTILISLDEKDGGGVPKGVLLLKFAAPLAPDAAWHQPLKVLGQYCLNALDTLDIEINWVTHQRTLYGHELMRNVTALIDVKSRIQSVAISDPHSLDRRRELLDLALKDLSRSTEAIRVYSAALTDGTLVRHPNMDPRLAALTKYVGERRKRRWPAIDIRDTFHAATNSRRQDANARRVDFAPVPLFQYPKLRVSDLMLYEVLGTLVDNAIKYSSAGARVSSSVNYIGGSFTFTLSNIGPELSPEEEMQIFIPGFRGDYARSGNRPGRGLGLGFAQSVMGMMNGDLDYEQSAPRAEIRPMNGFSVNWHHFTLTFPRGVLYHER